jgi:type I site-specific restriction endonuclease
LICRETTLGQVEIIDGKPRRRSAGRTDYTLRVRVSADSQPVAVALLEAKKDTLPPGHGLEQVKAYLDACRHNVQFVFSSGQATLIGYRRAGRLFVESFRNREWRGTIVSLIIDLTKALPLNQIYREMPLPEGWTNEDFLFEH